MTRKDTYSCFKELAEEQRAGQDYRIRLKYRGSPITILAPHGGKIEPKTSEIARAIANNDFNFYCFEGIKKSCNYEILHITSHHFDEPKCVRLVSHSKTVVAIHGCRGRNKAISIGGRDVALRKIIVRNLRLAGFKTINNGLAYPARHKSNICNRGTTGEGIQLEVPNTLRHNFHLKHFATIVREAIKTAQVE